VNDDGTRKTHEKMRGLVSLSEAVPKKTFPNEEHEPDNFAVERKNPIPEELMGRGSGEPVRVLTEVKLIETTEAAHEYMQMAAKMAVSTAGKIFSPLSSALKQNKRDLG